MNILHLYITVVIAMKHVFFRPLSLVWGVPLARNVMTQQTNLYPYPFSSIQHIKYSQIVVPSYYCMSQYNHNIRTVCIDVNESLNALPHRDAIW